MPSSPNVSWKRGGKPTANSLDIPSFTSLKPLSGANEVEEKEKKNLKSDPYPPKRKFAKKLITEEKDIKQKKSEEIKEDARDMTEK